MWKLCLVFFLAAAALTEQQQPSVVFSQQSKVVESKQGSLQGLLLEFHPNGGDRDLAGKKVQVFRGIPFAAPPLGSLRFLPPVTASSWKGVRKATEFAPVCPQRFPDTSDRAKAMLRMSAARFREVVAAQTMLANQSEDCLYLNVYAPLTADSDSKPKLLPVVLFIHGDDYEWGSGNIYDPSVFAAFGKVVVITMNYRLGILGFLNANVDGDSQHPANLGILDQIAALHWIQENVASFGGDPASVSLMGHGTGAACVHFLMTSEALPEGLLFHRVILMSGSAISPWSVVKDSEKAALSVASALNCSAESSRVILQCLRSQPLEVLLRIAAAAAGTDAADDNSGGGSVFRPKWGPSFDGVVVHSFRHDIRDYLERMSRYDLIFGLSTAEALHLLNDRQLQYGMDVQERNKMLSDLVADTYKVHQREIFSAVVTEYTDWQSAVRHPVGVRDGTLMAIQDALFAAPLIETGDYHASLNKNSWFYVFDYQSKNSAYKQRQGAVHGENLKYVFGTVLLSENPAHSETETSIAKLMMTFWSNFVTSGNPNVRTNSISFNESESSSNWSRYDPKFKYYLHIGGKTRVRDHYRCKEMALWLNLVPDLQSAAKASQGKDDNTAEESADQANSNRRTMLNYKLYSEMLPFVPSLKAISISPRYVSTPASSEVVWPNASSNAHLDSSNGGIAGFEVVNSTFFSSPGFANYSTALSVTIAIGCSLLVLNVLIFAAVYYQRDRSHNPEHKVEPFGFNIQQVQQQHGGQHSISQYVDGSRRVRLRQSTSGGGGGSDRRSLRMEEDGSNSPPRKSALKQQQQRSSQQVSMPHRLQHIPPPEFADEDSFMMASAASLLPSPGQQHLRTFPRSVSPLPPGSATCNGGSTLPLKSSLKKAPKAFLRDEHRRPSNEELRV